MILELVSEGHYLDPWAGWRELDGKDLHFDLNYVSRLSCLNHFQLKKVEPSIFSSLVDSQSPFGKILANSQ